MYEFGKIVLVPFPFTDLTSTKLRPALIISKTDKDAEDLIVCFITSRINDRPSSAEFLFKTYHKDFLQSGLKVDSVIRFNKIATLNKKLVLGELGAIPTESLNKLKKNFLSSFGF